MLARIGVRGRSALVATAAVGALLGVGSVVFVELFEQQATRTVDDALRARAGAVVRIVATGGVGAVDTARLPGDALLVQVIQDGRVATGTAGLTSVLPSDRRETTLPDDRDETYRLFAVATRDPAGTATTVVVAESLEPVATATRLVVIFTSVGAPLLLLAVALLTGLLAGRALRPVEAMRRRAEDLDAHSLHVRIPVPRSRDEPYALALTLNAMLDRLEAATARQRQFVADASHELRSPIAALRTTVEVGLLHGGHDPAAADVVLAECDRLAALVDDLLLLATTDEGKPAHHDDVDLDDVVRDEVNRARRPGGPHITMSAPPVRVHGSRDHLCRATRNLLDNAIRHARSTVHVEVVVRPVDGRLDAVLTVRDDGPGVPPDQRTAVFDRFVRLDSGRARTDGGAGLGLAIVAQIAREHGGSAAFRAAAEVELRLPAVVTDH